MFHGAYFIQVDKTAAHGQIRDFQIDSPLGLMTSMEPSAKLIVLWD